MISPRKTFAQHKALLLLLLLMLSINSFAQVSFAGRPATYSIEIDDSHLPTFNAKLNQDVNLMIARDNDSQQTHGKPPRVAEAIALSIDLATQGEWSQLSDGNYVCRLRVRSEGALALLFSYSDFYIPQDASLYIYNNNRTHILGAYTHKTNPKGGLFATEMVAGDDVIFEYVSPSKELLPRINIDEVGYCYNHISVNGLSTRAGESGQCMVNINCEEGDEWQEEKKGVAHMLMYISGNISGAGWYFCTGTLINNTREDNTPYFLSAHHCYEGARETQDLPKWLFYFNYETADCSNAELKERYSVTGCVLRAAIPLAGGSDGLLLELTQELPEEWDLYFNGWDRRNKRTVGQGVGIHHPKGDVKKISTFDSYTSSTWTSDDMGAFYAHWNLVFLQTINGHGVTEGGSSGSPMFTSEHLVTGTLTGGNSSCSYSAGSNYYGKMSYHWDKYGETPATQMKTWLDPLDSGVETLAGRPYVTDRPRLMVDTKNMVFYSTKINQPGDIQAVGLKTFNLTEGVVVTAEGDFALSLDDKEWSKTITTPAEGGSLSVCYMPQNIGTHEGKITLSQPQIANNTVITLTASSCPQFDVDELPRGIVSQPYNHTINVTGGKAPYTFDVVSGKLPEGLQLTAEGTFSGTPTYGGFFTILINITDANGCSALYHQSLYIGGDVVVEFPFQETFESSSVLPIRWSQQYEVGEMEWTIQSRPDNSYNYPKDAAIGNNNAYFQYSGTTDSRVTKLISSQLDLTEVGAPYLSFWLSQRMKLRNQDTLTVYYRTSIAAEWTLLRKFGENVREWEKFELELPNPSAEYFIAFEAHSANGNGVALDDISVYATDESGISGTTANNDIRIEYDALVDDRLNVSWNTTAQTITIINSVGETVYSKAGLAQEQAISISTSQWSSGVYIVKVQCDNSTQVARFIKK